MRESEKGPQLLTRASVLTWRGCCCLFSSLLKPMKLRILLTKLSVQLGQLRIFRRELPKFRSKPLIQGKTQSFILHVDAKVTETWPFGASFFLLITVARTFVGHGKQQNFFCVETKTSVSTTDNEKSL